MGTSCSLYQFLGEPARGLTYAPSVLAFLRSLLGPRYWLLAYASFGVGLALPYDLRRLGAIIPAILCSLMFFTSLRVEPRALADELARRTARRRVLVLAGTKLLVLPAVVFATLLALGSPWALGVLLISSMPAGLSSVAFADVSGGRVEPALLVVLATSLLCPLTIPLLMQIGALASSRTGAELSALDVATRAGFIAAILLGPFIAAQLVRRRAPGWVNAHREHFSPLALGCLLLLNFSATASTRALWLAQPPRALVEPLIAVTFSAGLALAAGFVARRVLPLRDAIAFGANAVYVNNGLGIAFALTYFEGDRTIVLPAILMVIPIVWMVTLVGRGARRTSWTPTA